MSSPDCRVQAFLAAGHVRDHKCEEYPPLAAKYRVPIVVTGFEPMDVLQGILMCCSNWSQGGLKSRINTFALFASRAINRRRNWFARCSGSCRASGAGWEIPASGLGLAGRPTLPLMRRKSLARQPSRGRTGGLHLSGQVLQGQIKPRMPGVWRQMHARASARCDDGFSEGACAAHYRYRRHSATETALAK